MSIEVKNLLKVYGEQKAVNDVSFKVGKGEIVGFLGPNGAGKSTTMKIITGYLEKTSGEAFVCGMNVADQPLETKKKSGYLPELNALYYDMYVREYLAFVADDRRSNRRQHSSSSNTVRVSFKESIDKNWLEQLSDAKSVNKIDANNWQLATDNPEQLRKQIFERSLLHNLNIVSLQNDSQSLEDVFRSLTQKAE